MVRRERNLTNSAEQGVGRVGRVMKGNLSPMPEYVGIPTASSSYPPVLPLQAAQEALQVVVGAREQGLVKAGEQAFAEVSDPLADVVDEGLVLRLVLRIAAHL